MAIDSEKGLKRTVLIIGAGPAGLTAAYELLEKSDICPIVLEASDIIGGISRTVDYKGNKIDIGGHRFFSKSEVVMKWWEKIMPFQGDMPLQNDLVEDENVNSTKEIEKADLIMLIRNRVSRIFYRRKFFDYPVTLNFQTLNNLGFYSVVKILVSYLKIRIFPIKEEKSLEDFFTNRFGRELYLTFFKDYTEKVWGTACSNIKPEWGAQRVKGLSITKLVFHMLFGSRQGKVETSLIDRFYYPKFGPGQLWESVAKKIEENGGRIIFNRKVVKIEVVGEVIKSVFAENEKGVLEKFEADYFFSTMPVKDLICAFDTNIPSSVKSVADGLLYRDFITVGLLVEKMKIKNETKIKTATGVVPDNWIYIQERDVKVGRLQIFNNWSPFMVKDPSKVWVGLEYFCNVGDDLWEMPEKDFKNFAVKELVKIGLIDQTAVLDSVVIKMPKAYPAYFGTYEHFDNIKEFVTKFQNLFLIGRNGMHRYNNMDHSMLTAIIAAKQVMSGKVDHEEIWQVNTEKEYHESKSDN